MGAYEILRHYLCFGICDRNRRYVGGEFYFKFTFFTGEDCRVNKLQKDFYTQYGKKSVKDFMDWYLNDSAGSAEFIDNTKKIFNEKYGRGLADNEIEFEMIKMAEDGLLMVFMDMAYGTSGLMLQMPDGNWKRV